MVPLTLLTILTPNLATHYSSPSGFYLLDSPTHVLQGPAPLGPAPALQASPNGAVWFCSR